MNRTRTIVMIIALWACVSAHAATISVTNTNDSGAGSLRAALASAADGDTINFAVATPAAITLTTGELVVSKSVTILGPGPGALAVDGNAASSVFVILNSVTAPTVSISGLTISNGLGYNGGGIANKNSTLTVSNCTFSGNVASPGFGGGAGGGIFHGGYGNTIPTLTVRNCTFIANSAAKGGGIYNDAGFDFSGGSATLTIANSTLSGNSASLGGGLYNNGQPNGDATMTVKNCTLTGNSAGYGGGIYNHAIVAVRATLTISASTLSDNVADFGGGGIVNDGMTGNAILQIANSTFSGNSSFEGPGGILNGPTGVVALDIGSTILNAGAAGANIQNVAGSTVTSHGFNLSSDDGGGFLTATADQINTDPLLEPAGLHDNGGPTPTISLQTNSPAIDKGKRNAIPALASNTDQRGFPRTWDDSSVANATGGDGSDIGAFEAQTIQPIAHDFAIVKMKAPKKITLSATVTNVVGKFSVSIQNNSDHEETIQNMEDLTNLVTVSVQSLSNCPSFFATILPPKATFPIALAPRKKLTLALVGNFNCPNDPATTSKTAAHNDYRIVATVNHAVLDGNADTQPADDTCPHNPFGTDKGCGGKNPDGTLGGDVFTDVAVK